MSTRSQDVGREDDDELKSPATPQSQETVETAEMAANQTEPQRQDASPVPPLANETPSDNVSPPASLNAPIPAAAVRERTGSSATPGPSAIIGGPTTGGGAPPGPSAMSGPTLTGAGGGGGLSFGVTGGAGGFVGRGGSAAGGGLGLGFDPSMLAGADFAAALRFVEELCNAAPSSAPSSASSPQTQAQTTGPPLPLAVQAPTTRPLQTPIVVPAGIVVPPPPPPPTLSQLPRSPPLLTAGGRFGRSRRPRGRRSPHMETAAQVGSVPAGAPSYSIPPPSFLPTRGPLDVAPPSSVIVPTDAPLYVPWRHAQTGTDSSGRNVRSGGNNGAQTAATPLIQPPPSQPRRGRIRVPEVRRGRSRSSSSRRRAPSPAASPRPSLAEQPPLRVRAAARPWTDRLQPTPQPAPRSMSGAVSGGAGSGGAGSGGAGSGAGIARGFGHAMPDGDDGDGQPDSPQSHGSWESPILQSGSSESESDNSSMLEAIASGLVPFVRAAGGRMRHGSGMVTIRLGGPDHSHNHHDHPHTRPSREGRRIAAGGSRSPPLSRQQRAVPSSPSRHPEVRGSHLRGSPVPTARFRERRGSPPRRRASPNSGWAQRWWLTTGGAVRTEEDAPGYPSAGLSVHRTLGRLQGSTFLKWRNGKQLQAWDNRSNPCIGLHRGLFVLIYTYADQTYEVVTSCFEQPTVGWRRVGFRDTQTQPFDLLCTAMVGRDPNSTQTNPAVTIAVPDLRVLPSGVLLVKVREGGGGPRVLRWVLRPASAVEALEARVIWEGEYRFRRECIQSNLEQHPQPSTPAPPPAINNHAAPSWLTLPTYGGHQWLGPAAAAGLPGPAINPQRPATLQTPAHLQTAQMQTPAPGGGAGGGGWIGPYSAWVPPATNQGWTGPFSAWVAQPPTPAPQTTPVAQPTLAVAPPSFGYGHGSVPGYAAAPAPTYLLRPPTTASAPAGVPSYSMQSAAISTTAAQQPPVVSSVGSLSQPYATSYSLLGGLGGPTSSRPMSGLTTHLAPHSSVANTNIDRARSGGQPGGVASYSLRPRLLRREAPPTPPAAARPTRHGPAWDDHDWSEDSDQAP